MTVLTKLDDLKKEPKALQQIGWHFESTGLCSLDVLKILKKAMLQVQVEQDVFE